MYLWKFRAEAYLRSSPITTAFAKGIPSGKAVVKCRDLKKSFSPDMGYRVDTKSIRIKFENNKM